MITKVYHIENLDCAGCAAKIERKASAIDDVYDLSITFSTMQLHVTAEDPDALIPKILEAAQKIEPDITFTPYKRKSSSHTHNHEEHIHSINCSCDEHHNHHHSNDCDCNEHNHDTGCDSRHKHHHDTDCNCNEYYHNENSERYNTSNTHSAAKTGFKIGSQKKEIAEILFGIIIFIAAVILQDKLSILPILLFAASYLILGCKVLLKAVKNIIRGQIFDENFLMSIATIGAFIIQNYAEGVGVMLFYRIGELFENIAVAKSRTQIIDAIDMRPETVNLVAGNDIRIIPAQDAKKNDILLVRPGDRIPLDGIIADGETRIDTSPVTGEPVPVKATTGSSVVSGCINISGAIKIKVQNELEESMVTKILNSVENAAAGKPKIDRFITKFARVYTPIVVMIALLTAIIPSLITSDWSKWIYTALSFLVISCPCALVLSVPLAFFSGIGAGSKRGILFKSGLSIEALSKVKVVVMDKTGTITKGDFSVQNVITVSEYSADELLSFAASCELNSSHPIGVSIVEAVKNKDLKLIAPDSVEEISGHGIKAEVSGHVILCGNMKLMNKFNVSTEDYSNNSFGSEVIIAVDTKYAGYIIIADTIKPETEHAIKRIKKYGITTAMLTGDSLKSAKSIARITGINEIHAKLLPEDKLIHLQKIREKNGAVMFVGDGINDALVLAGADVGAAMGSGADAAIEAADVVFMKSDVEAIPDSIAIAKATSLISKENVIFALTIKALFMILGLLGFASMWVAVFADTGVAMICILNSIRALYKKY